MKSVWVAVGIFVVLLICGVGYYKLSNARKITPAHMTSASPTSPSMFSSIQDALAHSLTLSCDYTDASGTHVVAYIKNGAIRADVTSNNAQENGSTIMKGGKVYFWNSHEAVILTLPTITPNPTTGPSANAQSGSTGQNLLQTMEQYKADCHPAVVADSLFVQPSNITFTDMSAIMMTHSPSAPGATGVPIINKNYQQTPPPVQKGY